MNFPRILFALPVHLRSFCIALFLAASIGFACLLQVDRIERRWIHALTSETAFIKNQGAALQRAAFAERDLLPLYGSSEIVKDVPGKASVFFASYPSGFAVFPVGRAGCTDLILLQKIAAAASGARGHKVAIILSPGWFLSPAVPRHDYEGNFSTLQASYLIFSSPLSMSLKHDIACRLRDYPKPLEKSPLLQFAVHKLAGGGFLNAALYYASRPLGCLQNAVLSMQDHFETVDYIFRERAMETPPVREESPLHWRELFARAVARSKTLVDSKIDPRFGQFAGDGDYVDAVLGSREWTDLELLLRTIKELQLDPLLLSMPIERRHLMKMGISRASAEVYQERLREFASRYEIDLESFADHEGDPKFFEDHYDHLSIDGWMHFDKALDHFYHFHRR